MPPFSIYIHLPYCLHKCPYCDFNTYAVSQLPDEAYTAALLSELDYRATLPEWQNRKVQTIYFGGGTPSLFRPASLSKIVSLICRRLPVKSDLEISMELNPGTVTADTLADFLSAGINRMSFGAQSFQPEMLKALGRTHSVSDILSGIETARDVGCSNVSLDLMYGTPGQTLDDLLSDLEQVRGINPEHVSAYGLTIEKGTPYYFRFKTGRLDLPTEDHVIEMMDEMGSGLENLGLKRYEISNFSKPGFEARHNMAYWNGDDYLGLGAGAHSCCSNQNIAKRWANYSLPNKYMAEISAHGCAESWADDLSDKDLMFLTAYKA